MPSGNATITYTGDEPTITFSGETFVQGEPTRSADQGVIGGAKGRDDFTVVDHRAGEAPAPIADQTFKPEVVASTALPEPPASPPAAPVAAKPKPAKAKASPKKH